MNEFLEIKEKPLFSQHLEPKSDLNPLPYSNDEQQLELYTS